MAKFIRYALASFCFAASVGCLGLWWRMSSQPRVIALMRYDVQSDAAQLEIHRGLVTLAWFTNAVPWPTAGNWHISADAWDDDFLLQYNEPRKQRGIFGIGKEYVYFPLWYPALVFALAGVAALRLDRSFTLRSAIIATTVVAGLLGMAVGM